MEKEQIIRQLNSLLKGEHMAVNAYDKLIGNAEEAGIRNELQNIQLQHKNHSYMLAERIRSLGGTPDYNTGISGAFTIAKLSLDTKRRLDPLKLLMKVYDGEDKGIASAEGIARQELDEASRNLVNGILSEDHDHLKTMLNLMSEYGYKQ